MLSRIPTPFRQSHRDQVGLPWVSHGKVYQSQSFLEKLSLNIYDPHTRARSRQGVMMK